MRLTLEQYARLELSRKRFPQEVIDQALAVIDNKSTLSMMKGRMSDDISEYPFVLLPALIISLEAVCRRISLEEESNDERVAR